MPLVSVRVSRGFGGNRADAIHVDDEDRGVQMLVASGLATTMDLSDDDVGYSVWIGDLCVYATGEHRKFLGLRRENNVNWRRIEWQG